MELRRCPKAALSFPLRERIWPGLVEWGQQGQWFVWDEFTIIMMFKSAILWLLVYSKCATITHCPVPEYCHRPLKKPCTSQFPHPAMPWKPLIYFLPLQMCLFWTFHIFGILQNVAFCIWLLSLSIKFYRSPMCQGTKTYTRMRWLNRARLPTTSWVGFFCTWGCTRLTCTCLPTPQRHTSLWPTPAKDFEAEFKRFKNQIPRSFDYKRLFSSTFCLQLLYLE